MAFAKFVSNHKVAIAVTAVVGAGSVAGLIYYTNKQNSLSSDNSSASKKKKSKKSKKAKKPAEESSPVLPTSTIFPVNATTGLPEVTEEQVASLSPEEKEKWALSLKEYGNEIFKKKDYQLAIAYYTSALLCKVDPVFYANRAACYAALQEDQKSIDDCTEAIKINPTYAKCFLRRCHAYENLEMYKEALIDMTALMILGGLNGKSNEAIYERLLMKYSGIICEEQYSTINKDLPSASSMSSFFGSFTRDSVDIPESELEEGSFEKYLHEALEQIKLDTVDGYEKADVFLNQAVSRYEAGDNSSIDKKLAALAYEYKGAFDFLKADSANAAVIIKKALKLSPRPRSHVLLALIAAEGTDFDPNSPNTAYTDVAYKEALGEFQKAIELDANSKDIYYNYGQIFYLIGDLASAKEKFEKAKELNPDNVYAYIQLACIAYKQGEISTCQALFKDAKRRFPVSPDVINYYGEILYDMKDFDGAEKQFDNAIKLQDALPTFNVGALPLINKALICKERQDIESHELYLARACQLDQKNETAREHLSVIYTAQKKFDECDKVLDEACAVARSPIDLRRFVVLKITNDLHRHVSKDRVLSAKLEQLQREVATQYAAAIASGAAPPQGM